MNRSKVRSVKRQQASRAARRCYVRLLRAEAKRIRKALTKGQRREILREIPADALAIVGVDAGSCRVNDAAKLVVSRC